MRLRTKIGVMLAVATIVLSAGVYGGIELYKDQVVAEARLEVDETAAVTADQLDTVVEDRMDFIGYVASRPDAARYDRSGVFLAELVDNSRFFAAQVVAANGTVIDIHGDITTEVQREAVGRDVGDRTYVREALAGDVSITDPVYSEAAGRHVAIISAPIFEDREIVGLVAAAIYVDRLTFFSMVGAVETRDQRVVIRSGETTLYTDSAPFDRAITSRATVEETGWTVTVARDRRDLLAQLRLLGIAQGLGLFAVLLVMAGFAAWQYRSTLQQIESLLRGFAALSSGDYDHSLSLSEDDEWQQISEGFNELGAALGSRERELRRRRQRLEVLNRVLRHNLRHSAAVLLGYGEQVQSRAQVERVRAAGNEIIDAVMTLTAIGEKARMIEEVMADEGEPDRLDLHDILDGVLSRVRAAFPEVSVTASVPGRVYVRAHPSLELALENALENACEHNTADEPTVDLTVVEDEAVAIRIEDNGPGLPDHERRVLDEGSETPLEHGSGLGMWLIYWGVERSDGELTFDMSDGDGTTVTIALARAEPDEPTEPADAGLNQSVPDRPAAGSVADGPAER